MGRSYCPKCRHQIAWYDNIPVISFILLKAKCRYCHKSISWQYPLIEIITALLFLFSFHANVSQEQFSLLIMRDWLLIITLLVVFVYDLRWQLVPMIFVWPMTVVLFAIGVLLGVAWWQLLFYAAIGALFFLVQYVITRKKGVGEGDIWLGVLLGIVFPYSNLLLFLVVASYGLGSVISVFLLGFRKKGWKSQIALGPFLALGAIITLFWGEKMINWYLALF